MDVFPHRGIDDIVLGRARDTITRTLGKPDRTAADHHEDGAVSEIWTYRMLRLELSFDSDHAYRLAHITSYHPFTFVRGFNPIGLTSKHLLMKYPHLELDIEVSPDEKYYSDRALNLTFGLARGKVVSVTVFPEYDDAGEVIKWPQAED